MEFKNLVAFFAVVLANVASAKNVHYIHWNRNNPMFRIDNTDHIVDVNRGNLPWEYDQVNLICPVSKAGTRHTPERHVIYSVSKEEYESCRITNPKPRIVAVCNQPHRLMYFTITFRSFTPTPGGLEFHPGHDYYFISTSSQNDLHRRVGGGCSTHNMRMIFKVHDNTNGDDGLTVEAGNDDAESANGIEDSDNDLLSSFDETTTTSTSTSTPAAVPSVYRGRASQQQPRRQPPRRHRGRGGEYIYYYHPRDLIELENSLNEQRRSSSSNGDSDAWSRKEAMRYTSGGDAESSSSAAFSSSLCLLTLSLFFCLWR